MSSVQLGAYSEGREHGYAAGFAAALEAAELVALRHRDGWREIGSPAVTVTACDKIANAIRALKPKAEG